MLSGKVESVINQRNDASSKPNKKKKKKKKKQKISRSERKRRKLAKSLQSSSEIDDAETSDQHLSTKQSGDTSLSTVPPGDSPQSKLPLLSKSNDIQQSLITEIKSENNANSDSISHVFGFNADPSNKIARSVEFVFPRQYQQTSEKQAIPYCFTKLKQAGAIPNENSEHSAQIVKSTDEISALQDESIDDILYPERKKKRPEEIEKENEIIKVEEIVGEKKEISKLNREQLFSSEVEKEEDVGYLNFPEGKNKNNAEDPEKTNGKITDSNLEINVKESVGNRDALIEEKLKKKKDSNKEKSSVAKNGELEDQEVTNNMKMKHSDDKDKKKGVSRIEVEQSDVKEDVPKTKKRKRMKSEDFTEEERMMNRQLSGLTVEDAVKDRLGRRPRSNSTDGELNLPRRGLCDERMVLESHKWNVDKLYNGKARKLKVPPRGFGNLGNTCFLNATLQCLAYLPTFCQCVATLPPLHGDIMNGGKRKSISNGQRITMILRSLIRQVHGLEGIEQKQGPIAPRNMVKSISLLGGTGRGYKFRPGRQEDAHEFLVHLLDAMNDGELKAAGINQKISGWRDRLPIPRLDETTFVHRMFGGYLRSQVQCTRCGYNSNTYDPFLDLALEVSKKSSNSVADAFAEFTRKETLDAANKYKCSGCKKRVCATKQLTMFRPPLSLIIQLKRFTFGGHGGYNGWTHHKGGWGSGYGHFSGKGMGMMNGGSKIQKPIQFPMNLQVPLSDKRKCEYILTGLVIHVGGSATSGHYTSYVRKPGHNGSNSWYHMDDSYVEPVSEKTVLKQKDAYVLFYCRKEVKLEIPSPPPRSMTAEEAKKVGQARARARSNSMNFSNGSNERNVAENASTEAKSIVNYKKLQKESGLINEIEKTSASDECTLKNKCSSPLIMSKASSEEKPSVTSNTLSSESSASTSDSDNSQPENLNSVKKSLDSAMKKTLVQAGENVLAPNAHNDNSKLSEIANESDRKDANQSKWKKAINHGEKEIRSSNDTEPDPPQSPSIRSTSPSASKAQNDDDSLKKRIQNKENGNKKSVDLNLGLKRGTVKVLLGQRKKNKAWKPALHRDNLKDVNGLLGNVNVAKWDDDPDTIKKENGEKGVAELLRDSALKEMISKERSRKRKMHLDSWDSKLDEGKTKKVKNKSSSLPFNSVEPKKNQFHRLQASMQKFNRGRPKGAQEKPNSIKKKISSKMRRAH